MYSELANVKVIEKSNIDDEFTGFDDKVVFHLSNGQYWQQSQYKYNYFYAYRPQVVIFYYNGCHYI